MQKERSAGLLEEVRAYVQGHPQCQAEVEKVLSLQEWGDLALSRDHYEPGHMTASAFVLSPDKKQLLLIRHKKLMMWLQPGGHWEENDSDHLQAATRELREETGIEDIEVIERLFDIDVHQIPALKDKPAHLHHDLRVLFQSKTWEAVGADDAAEAAWFPLEELVSCQGSLRDGLATDESVRRAASRLLCLLSADASS